MYFIKYESGLPSLKQNRRAVTYPFRHEGKEEKLQSRLEPLLIQLQRESRRVLPVIFSTPENSDASQP